MTTDGVMARFNVGRAAVCRWAARNGVKREIDPHGIAAYVWTEEDCLRFAARTGPGWKKGRARKGKK